MAIENDELTRIVAGKVAGTQEEALEHLAHRPPNSIKTIVVYS